MIRRATIGRSALCAFLCCSCFGGGPPAANVSDPVTSLYVTRPAAEQNGQLPMVVEWVEHSRTGSRAEVSLVVQKFMKTDSALTVWLRLPPGMTAQPPILSFEIPAGEAGVWRNRMTLASSAASPDDAIAVVSTRGTGFGFHAEVPYRFGRPELKGSPSPRKSGPPLWIGSHNLGQGIPVQPTER